MNTVIEPCRVLPNSFLWSSILPFFQLSFIDFNKRKKIMVLYDSCDKFFVCIYHVHTRRRLTDLGAWLFAWRLISIFEHINIWHNMHVPVSSSTLASFTMARNKIIILKHNKRRISDYQNLFFHVRKFYGNIIMKRQGVARLNDSMTLIN